MASRYGGKMKQRQALMELTRRERSIRWACSAADPLLQTGGQEQQKKA
jgi:hypothetical protein